jgi:XTP/dITP diphosphohydrolase
MRVVVATGNPGKLRELSELLSGLGLELLSQSALGVTGIEETGATFVENALLKARHASQCTGLAAIADDSGLEVDALGGAPGIYSARYAGAQADDAANNAKLAHALFGVPAGQRTARYRCVLAWVSRADDSQPLIAQGLWEGEIVATPSGRGGFGYDPHFWLPSLQRTAAELDAATKNLISHRGQAMRTLRSLLQARQ